MDYQEAVCCFDASAYIGVPDAEPTAEGLEVPRLIAQLDSLYNTGREDEAGDFLLRHLQRARELGDWRGELSMLSELMGHCRRSGDRQLGLRAVNDGLSIIRQHHLGSTVSGATVLLNAATTMKCFGHAAESVPYFEHVARVYADNLEPRDYRFAGLYNNMALSYEDVGDYANAERHFRLAISALAHSKNPDNELAVTWCNLAELYDKQNPEDERCTACMEKAWEHLNAENLPHDGYHAFTISKCAPSFDYFGFFLYAQELRERAEAIYAGT